MIPEDIEDLWQVYNLISKEDKLTTSTFRKVVSAKQTSVTSQKVRTNVTLSVTSTEFDSKDGGLRVSGRNIRENRHMKLGAYHTSLLEPNRKFTLFKDCWDYMLLKRLNDAADPTKKAKLAAIVMQPGLANVCLITANLTLVRAKVEKSLPKKRGNYTSNAHLDAKKKFFKHIFDAFIKNIDLKIVKCVIVASPGFINGEFLSFLNEEVSRLALKPPKPVPNATISLEEQIQLLKKNKGLFVKAHSSTGLVQALEEVLSDPKIVSRVQDVSVMQEVAVLNEFFDTLRKNPDQAVYSLRHVRYALKNSAVKTLLVSDELFRSHDVAQRRVYVNLVEKVERLPNVKVAIFSSMHHGGKRLNQMTGIAAILRYPLQGIDDHFESLDQMKNQNKKTEAVTDGKREEETFTQADLHPEIYF